MRQIIKRIERVLKSVKGALSVEQMVLIFVALTIATVIFIFRDTVVDFIGQATTRLGGNDFNL
jgi:hypothetical protein